MLKRVLLLLVALALLAGAVAGVFWFLNARKGEATPRGGTAENGDGLPVSGERAASPASEPSSAETLSLACPERWEGLPDSDQDGLPDQAEALYRTDDATADTDGDGFSDSAEVRAGYDPAKKEGNPRLDSDSDGLLDSDECRWKTNPFATDTDGDGFEDGAEVANKFDPASKGDGQGSDALPERRARVAQAALERFRPRKDSDNYTERAAALALGDRPLEDLATLTVTPQDLEQVLRQFPVATTLPAVPLSELTVTSANTPTNIARYQDDLKRLRPADLGDAGAVANAIDAALQGNAVALGSLQNRILQYESDLRVVQTPPSAVAHHRHLVALTRFVADRLGEMIRYATSDPVRATLALKGLQKGFPPAAERLDTLRSDLEQLAGTPPTS